jgi:DNA repair protein RecO (recombination protein O)
MPRRERVYRTEGIVLRRHDLGEADRLTTVYTLDYGKRRLVAKGVRRLRSRKAGHLEPFTRVALLIARGRELDIITQAETMEDFPHLRDDLVLFGHASCVIELLDRFSVEGSEENRSLYRLLLDSLTHLAYGTIEPQAIVLYFEIRLLDLVGYRPELFQCLSCGAEIKPEDQFFSSHEGGVLCPKCGKSRRNVRPVSLSALKLLRHYQRSSFENATAPQVHRRLFQEVESIMEDYLSYLLERRLHTPDFMRKLRFLEQRGLGENNPRT